MPSTYAHYCFGKAVYRRLPQEIQEEIKAYSPLYMTGLHGPDILFYYKPLKPNAINRIGYGMHGRPAVEFFEKAWMRARELPEGRGGFAYLYGFICHFALDHSCHPYIEKKIKESGVTHAEIEVEFDRMLLAKRGHNPLTHRLAGHIPTDMTSAGTIAEFFPEVTAEEVQQALKSMKHYNNLLVAPGHLKRGFIYALLAMTGNYKEMHGLIVNYKPNPKCADSNIRLSQLYHDAISLAVRLICEYRENGAEKTECAACVFKSRCRNSCGCKNYAATGSLSKVSPSMCAHEQTLIPIADDLAKRLLRNKYATFLRKPYDDFHSFRPEAEWAALRMV